MTAVSKTLSILAVVDTDLNLAQGSKSCRRSDSQRSAWSLSAAPTTEPPTRRTNAHLRKYSRK